jgi:hypothetical protein
VRIDSTPSGATVTLVDRGKSQFVGLTPVSAAVDPSREYDLVVSHDNRLPHRVHLDPGTTRRVAVSLERRSRSDRTERGERNDRNDRTERGERTDRNDRNDRTERGERTDRSDRGDRTERGEPADGTLMISSKPPCEIVIDGKPTGLMTPQRAITLPAGAHKITLINREQDVRKTVSVQITASATEKVIEDLIK